MTAPRANRLISILYRYGQRFFAQELRRAGFALEVGWLPALMQACHSPGVTQDGIALCARMDKGTVARALKQLEASGLITRVADEADRRINHIYPTPEAIALHPRVDEVLERLHTVLYKGLADEEIAQAVAVLELMRCNISAYLEEQTPPAEAAPEPQQKM